MVQCHECKYWDVSEFSWRNIKIGRSGICTIVDMKQSDLEIEILKQEFHIENDGHLDEASYLVTGRNFGCILGIYG